MMAALHDKSIIVTGAGRGIGAAVAKYLSREGAKLVVADLDGAAAERTAASLRDAGHAAVAHEMDVSSWEDCGALIQLCVDTYGRLDGLAGFAGINYLAKPWEETDGARARRLLEVNLLGSYHVGVHALQAMKRQGSGSIVNVTSGSQAGIAASAVYAASKGGVASLTYAWAIDAAEHGIRVNAVSPIATSAMTAQTDDYLRGLGQLQGPRPYIDPEVNAPAVAFLLSDLARDINGQILRVHGGQVQLMSHPAVMMPVMEREQWNVGTLATALAESFPDGLPPLGVTGIGAKFVALAKGHQVPR